MPTRMELLAQIKDPAKQLRTAVDAVLVWTADKHPQIMQWINGLDDEHLTYVDLLIGCGFITGTEVKNVLLKKDRASKQN